MTTNETDAGFWLEGGCHCGAVRFRVRTAARRHVACNCSVCAKKGMLGLIVPERDFQLVQGASDLETYRFNTGTAAHRFCRRCGIHPFSRPRSHPDGYDVNVRCLDEWRGDGDPAWESVPFDGQNWEASVDSIR